MKNFKYYNNIINEVVVHVDNLLNEQSPDDLRDKYDEISDTNISDEDRVQAIIDMQDDTYASNPKNIDIKELFDSTKNGEWPEGFPTPDELEKEFKNKSSLEIEEGPFKGMTLTAGVYDAIRVSRGIKSIRTKTNPLKKKKGHASICYCINFARKYTGAPSGSPTDDAAACPSYRKCYKSFRQGVKAELSRVNEFEAKLINEYRDDCLKRADYREAMFDFNVRKDYTYSDSTVPGSPYCAQWDKEVIPAGENLVSSLTSLLSKFFRIKNRNSLAKTAETGSVADKIVVNSKIEISFTRPSDFVSPGGSRNDAPPTFPDCVDKSFDITNTTIEFKVESASPFNGGKTVMLSKGRKYLLMTFSSAERGVDQNGSIKFVKSLADNEGMCPSIGWNGKITKLTI